MRSSRASPSPEPALIDENNFVPDGTAAAEREERVEHAAPLPTIELGIRRLPANQRRGVNRPIPVEPRLAHHLFQPPQLGVDGLVLVVNDKANNIEGAVSGERPKSPDSSTKTLNSLILPPPLSMAPRNKKAGTVPRRWVDPLSRAPR